MTISFNDINNRVGVGGSYSSSMSWIKSITKPSQVSNSLADYTNKYYYQKNNDGNCGDGNCATGPAQSGNKNCADCYVTAINCVNCDAQPYLQENCNCACTYNCNKYQYSINCDCACNCACWICACACW